MAKISFFNIGKANARIEELETALQKAENERESAVANYNTVAAEAERLKSDNLAKANSIAGHADAIQAKDREIAAVKAELVTAQNAVKDFDGRVASAASAKAMEICAKQGVTVPVTSTPAKDPATPKNEAGLTGMARVLAATNKQLDVIGRVK